VTRRQRVAVVTGGGNGIGAAIAEEIARNGWFVVTVDPLVTVDGAERLPEPEQTTAGRIVAAGGSAQASSVSVTDAAEVRELFGALAEEHGALDAVVNVAGITRKSGFAEGTEEDWKALLTVHLGGYLNVLGAALPVMERAGRGRIVGVTSGAGWRATDAGGYGCAKRVVASLTWQLGRSAPPGVTVNALSPIAATRMVAAAVERARQQGRAGGSAGFSMFDAMPGPELLGPLGAHVVGDRFGWCNGRVLFAGGSETAVIGEPRLLEVVRTSDVASIARVLEAVLPDAFAQAEANQATDGGGNPRFGPIFDEPVSDVLASVDVRSCVIATDRPALASAITEALDARSVTCHGVELTQGFAAADEALRAVAGAAGPVDAVVVAPSGAVDVDTSGHGWRRVLAEHEGIVDRIHADAGWARAAAMYAAASRRPIRLVTLTDATSAGGRSRAQASAQLARVAGATTDGRVSAFSVAVEAKVERAARSVGELVAYLLGYRSAGLAGAELVVGDGWVGVRSHPYPLGAVTYGGPAVPDWLDMALQDITGAGAPVTADDVV
jgi:NAD(P)-dependent dehydrogenase (short-subunit alcohol dehydrogenase family)